MTGTAPDAVSCHIGEAMSIAYTVHQLVRLSRSMRDVLPPSMPPQLVHERVAAAIGADPRIANCDMSSIAGSVLQLCQLGLVPLPSSQHGIELRARGSQCIVFGGYAAYYELARRAGIRVWSHVVRDGDHFRLDDEVEPTTVEHLPSDVLHARRRMPVIGVYAMATLANAKRVAFIQPGEALRSVADRLGGSPRPCELRREAVRKLWRQIPRTPAMMRLGILDDAFDERKPQQLAWDESVVAALKKWS